jgi:outer membrane protein
MIFFIRCLTIWSIAVFALPTAAASFSDPLSTTDLTVSSEKKAMLFLNSNRDPCVEKPIMSPLALFDAVEAALCHNTSTKQTWANVQYEAAQLGIKEAVYFPTVNATYTLSKDTVDTQVQGIPQASSIAPMTTRNGSIELSWLLFDFGTRRGDVEKHLQLLSAANALQDASLQTVFLTAAQDYYELLTAQGGLDASQQSEMSARENFLAAEAKYKAGAGPFADKLLAQTTLAQASLERVKAEGGVRAARGKLAIAMGQKVDTNFTLQSVSSVLPDTAFVQSVDKLISYASSNHPKMIAARAQLYAAQADLRVNEAEAYPSISLVGSLGHNDELGQVPANTYIHDRKIGIQITFPLFDGFNRSYLIQTSRAKLAQQEAALEDAEQQVSLDVWTNYQSLITETENLKATSDLLESSTQSDHVVQGRYKAGVGNILELLKGQNDLASARQQRIQALSNWLTARLKLAGSLGTLGIWAIK